MRRIGAEEMISSIHIRGYRGFADFEMSGLERVNLLVGKNNSGKTALLEALYLLVSRDRPSSLWPVLVGRGEQLESGDRSEVRLKELDISHLFTGHEIQLGSEFSIHATNRTSERKLTISVVPMTGETRQVRLQIQSYPPTLNQAISLTRSLAIRTDMLDPPQWRQTSGDEESHVQFIATGSLEGNELISLWDRVALTPDEGRVLSALKFLDEDIERIAAQAGTQNYQGRGGFIVKIKGREHPIPIGSMGDGMWRMMAMAIAIAHCKDGVLLVDEIDTGLHYTVMANMWRLILGTAKELDVQVFATTHSSDCIKSLAELCYEDANVAANVTLQRIEAGKSKSVPYTANEIEIAAEREIEVR
jgi:AAA15 family ATPase/GTPase